MTAALDPNYAFPAIVTIISLTMLVLASGYVGYIIGRRHGRDAEWTRQNGRTK